MRIDKYLFEKGYFDSRTKAREAIERGAVFVGGKTVRSSYEVDEASDISIKKERVFVSAGGDKLQKAFDDFCFSPKGLVFADIGASTGGFTDCLLLNGAKRVYAVDVGDSALHPRIAADSRVRILDHTNARFLKKEIFPEKLDGAVMDVSFISAKLLLPAVASILEVGAPFFLLIKPQFECEERRKMKNGIVRDPILRYKICEKILNFAADIGFGARDFTVAPLREEKNREYLVYFVKNEHSVVDCEKLKEIIMQNN